MAWIVNNWDSILMAITSVVTAASLIANMTPNQTDNAIIDKVKKVIDMLALNFKK